MQVTMITAGAAGMYCGSCLHDNTLAAALVGLGHDALLVPTYTPIRTDERDVSQSRVFFGGINVFLQEKIPLFRYTPWFLDRLLDLRPLLHWVSRYAGRTSYRTLGALTISMLRGRDGRQRKEVAKLVQWLADDIRPEIVTLTNVLLSGIVPALKDRLGVPVLAWLQGDDIFLDALDSRDRERCIELIRVNCQRIDGFLVTSRYYADFMSNYLGLPREKMHVLTPGLNLKGHGGGPPTRREPPYTLGYFARICPEKGLHHLVEAFRILKQTPGTPPCRLRVSGWLGDSNKAFFAECHEKLLAVGLGDELEYVPCPTHADKVRFLQSLDLLSVPTVYREPKGLYILEALANGVPVVQPSHGSFPELLEATGGGVLVPPNDPAALAEAMAALLSDPERRTTLSEQGQRAVQSRFTAAGHAVEVLYVLTSYRKGRGLP